MPNGIHYEHYEESDPMENALFIQSAPDVKTMPLRHHLVELTVLLEGISITIFFMIIPNTIESQYCRSVMNVSEKDCYNNSLEYNKESQKIVANVHVVRAFFETFIPTIILIFAGPWSDVHGRKFLMLSAIFGELMTLTLWGSAGLFPHFDPSYSMFLSIPMIFGAGPFMIFGTSCYACAITASPDRSFRLVMVGISFHIGRFIGSLICSYLIHDDYSFGFFIAAFFACVNLFYTHFFLEEHSSSNKTSSHQKTESLFKVEDIKKIATMCYTKQTYRMRIILLTVFLVQILSVHMAVGSETIEYLFLQRTQGWDLQTYNTLTSITILFHCGASLGGNWLLSVKLKLNDLYILIILILLHLLATLIYADSSEKWHIYIASILKSGHTLFGAVIKSFLSKIVSHEDIGKILTPSVVIENVSVFSAITTFNALYGMTLFTNPSMSFYVAASMAFIVLCLLLYANKLYKKEFRNYADFKLITNEDD